MRRREFMGIVAGTAAGVTLGQLGIRRLLPGREDPVARGRNRWGLSSEREPLSICGGCAAGCSVRLRIVDEHLVGIRGNRDCPLGHGGLCARGQSEVEAFYDPDRLLGPVRREAERGANSWKRDGWDAAIGHVARRLKQLALAGNGDRIAAILSSGDGATSRVVQRALAAMGSAHVYHVPSFRDEAARAFSSLAFGAARPYGYDLEHSDLVISFATPVLEGWLSPSYVLRRFGQGRKREHNRLRLIQVQSHLSRTALHADEWIPCTPGREALVALAMAQTLLREGLVRRPAVDALVGLDSWTDRDGNSHPGFREKLDVRYTPDTVSRETGVPSSEIRRLAHMFANARFPVAVAERTTASQGVFALAAAHLLNAITDRFGRKGGVTFPGAAPVRELDSAPAPEAARIDGPPTVPLEGTSIWRVLAGLQMQGQRPPFDVVFIEDGSALGDVMAGDPAFELLKKVPLVVSLARCLDRTAEVADLILPSTTPFEQPLDIQLAACGHFSAVAAARAALRPLVDGKPIAEVFTEFGSQIGEESFWSRNSLAASVDRRLKGLVRSCRGVPYGHASDGEWAARVALCSGEPPSRDTENALLEMIYSAGGWVDGLLPEAPLGPENRYAVDGRATRQETTATPLLAIPETDEAWFPDPTVRPTQDRSILNMDLVPIPLGTLIGQGTPNRATLLQLAAPRVRGAFGPWAELNPIDAERLSVGPGCWVRLRSAFGETELPVRIWAGVRPGTVAVPWALAAGGGGRFARSWQRSAEMLAGAAFSASGYRMASGFPVHVQRATGVSA